MFGGLASGCFGKVEAAPGLLQACRVHGQLAIYLGDHVTSPADEDILTYRFLVHCNHPCMRFSGVLFGDLDVLQRSQDRHQLVTLQLNHRHVDSVGDFPARRNTVIQGTLLCLKTGDG
jgi:hypothetical protein